MSRCCLFAVLLLVTTATAAEDDKPIEAVKSDDGIWTLGGQVWEFKDVASVYTPLKGTLDPKTGAGLWTLELARELTAGEAAAHGSVTGTPFKPVLLDEEKTTIAEDARVKITPVSGTQGDRIRMTVQLPKAETLAKVKLIRVQRRTQLGF